ISPPPPRYLMAYRPRTSPITAEGGRPMKLGSGGSRALIRVLVADSNQTQSQLLSSALRRQHHIKVTCCRGEPAHCLEALRSIPVDVVVLGGDAFDRNRIVDTTRALHSAHPNLGIVLLLDSYDRHLVVNAMRAGPVDCFTGLRSHFALFAAVSQ